MCARIVPRVQGVVYFTRSLVEMENETVVSTAIEYVTTVHQTKMPFRVSPPVLPLTEQDIEDENPLAGKFLRYTPTNFSSGCFIATITREVRHASMWLGVSTREQVQRWARPHNFGWRLGCSYFLLDNLRLLDYYQLRPTFYRTFLTLQGRAQLDNNLIISDYRTK